MKILVTGGSGFIGTNFIELLEKSGESEFINLDHTSPRHAGHPRYWKECDMLDSDRLRRIAADFQPTHVVHLAAKTGLNESQLEAFAANIQGVENVIAALRELSSVEHVLFTSSLLVCRMGYIPSGDADYQPTTLYGLSKVMGEQIVRGAGNTPYAWTIIRPISIWGPWGEEPYKNFFKAIAQGWYFHIGSGHYRRSLGYVGNTVHQIHRLLSAPREKTDKQTIYVSDDQPADLYDMANRIQKALGARTIYHVPLLAAKATAKAGDLFKAAGWHAFPLTTFRLNNILTEYVFNLQPIMDISAPLPYTLQDGVDQTIQWLREMREIQ